jgi:O-antigen ligase
MANVPIALIAALLTLLAFVPSQLAIEGSLTALPREVKLLLLLSVAGLLSVPLAVSPGDAIHTFWDPFLKAVIVFIVVVNAVRTERRLKGMFYLAMAVTCTLCFAALNNYRLGILTVEGYRIEGAITGGMFENTNDLGIHLVTMLPLAIMLGFAARNLLGKLFYWAIAFLTLATLVITFSRGAFIGLLGAVLVMSWKLARRRRLLVIISVTIGVMVFVAMVPGSYWIRLLSIFVPSLDPHGSSTARGEVLAHSLLVALRHPLTGIGMGNFSLVSMRGLVTHNSYTQVAAEMGTFALFLYAMFVTAPLHRLKKIERETVTSTSESRFYYLAVGLQASIVGYMLSSFFASVAYYWFIYYLVGYAVCFRRIYEARTSGKLNEPLANSDRDSSVLQGRAQVPGS